MGLTLCKSAYERLVKEDIEWLLKQPRSLERDHIRMILEASPKHEYDDQKSLWRLAEFYEFLVKSKKKKLAKHLRELLGYTPKRRIVVPT